MCLKNRLESRDITTGSWITIGNPIVAEIMAQSGFDWLVVDMEHSVITLSQAQNLIQVIELSGVSPLVRVGHNQPNLIKRVMDAGAHGVIVPMVNSKAEAEQAVASVKYPPTGFRGVGLARAQKYGANFENYKNWNQDKSVVIVQVEHIKAVENLEEILDVPGVDGFIVGPYDLSGSLGVPGQFDHPDVVKALHQVKTVSQQKNALSGFHVIQPDANQVAEKKKEGYQFIAVSLDILYLGNACKKTLATCNSNGEKDV
jgi:2-keto-3-deoxy-L-rhamnonate aldolase RhmA